MITLEKKMPSSIIEQVNTLLGKRFNPLLITSSGPLATISMAPNGDPTTSQTIEVQSLNVQSDRVNIVLTNTTGGIGKMVAIIYTILTRRQSGNLMPLELTISTNQNTDQQKLASYDTNGKLSLNNTSYDLPDQIDLLPSIKAIANTELPQTTPPLVEGPINNLNIPKNFLTSLGLNARDFISKPELGPGCWQWQRSDHQVVTLRLTKTSATIHTTHLLFSGQKIASWTKFVNHFADKTLKTYSIESLIIATETGGVTQISHYDSQGFFCEIEGEAPKQEYMKQPQLDILATTLNLIHSRENIENLDSITQIAS